MNKSLESAINKAAETTIAEGSLETGMQLVDEVLTALVLALDPIRQLVGKELEFEQGVWDEICDSVDTNDEFRIGLPFHLGDEATLFLDYHVNPDGNVITLSNIKSLRVGSFEWDFDDCQVFLVKSGVDQDMPLEVKPEDAEVLKERLKKSLHIEGKGPKRLALGAVFRPLEEDDLKHTKITFKA